MLSLNFKRIGTLPSKNFYSLAIEKRHWDIVDAMINSKIVTDESLEQKLLASVKVGNIYYTQMFLDKGAKPQGIKGEPAPLVYAVELENEELVVLLFKYGAKVPKAVEGNSCLHLAAKKGNIAIATYLLENGADVNAINGLTEWAPILMKLLLEVNMTCAGFWLSNIVAISLALLQLAKELPIWPSEEVTKCLLPTWRCL